MSDIAFLGGGNMASAIMNGINRGIKSGDLPQLIVDVFDKNKDKLEIWASLGASGFLNVQENLSNTKLWILAVKPQNMRELCESIAKYIREDTLILSVAAGLSTEVISSWLSGHKKIVRCMPNTPTSIGMGATGIFAPKSVTEQEYSMIKSILRTTGLTIELQDEYLMDSVGALSGSGPAYIFYFIEALVEGGVELGLDRNTSEELAIKTVIGAGLLASNSDTPVSKLRENVTSKGGTTRAALDVFEKNNFKEIVKDAMKAARNRSEQLSKENN